MSIVPGNLKIGMLIFPRMDQLDFTGAFEVFSRIPNSTVHVLWKDKNPINDVKGLILTPDTTLADCPDLDLLVVPGGYGQEDLMDDEEVLSLIRKQMRAARYVYAICTGVLICGAAGILEGRRATTNWTTFNLLPYFGATPVKSRVVEDGNLVCAAGVSATIDGALTVTAFLAGDKVAQQIQLYMEYAPQPPFESGTPETAPREILESTLVQGAQISSARTATAQRIAKRLGIAHAD